MFQCNQALEFSGLRPIASGRVADPLTAGHGEIELIPTDTLGVRRTGQKGFLVVRGESRVDTLEVTESMIYAGEAGGYRVSAYLLGYRTTSGDVAIHPGWRSTYAFPLAEAQIC